PFGDHLRALRRGRCLRGGGLHPRRVLRLIGRRGFGRRRRLGGFLRGPTRGLRGRGLGRHGFITTDGGFERGHVLIGKGDGFFTGRGTRTTGHRRLLGQRTGGARQGARKHRFCRKCVGVWGYA